MLSGEIMNLTRITMLNKCLILIKGFDLNRNRTTISDFVICAQMINFGMIVAPRLSLHINFRCIMKQNNIRKASALLAIALLLLIPLAPHADTQPELKWLGWNEGYAKAVKEGKIVLVDTYTEWCGWCKKMDRDTYTNAEIIKKINQHFVPVKFNPEIQGISYTVGDKSYSPQELYYMLSHGQSTGYPTTYFIYTKKMTLSLDAGYKGPEAFMQVLDSAIAESKK